MHEPKEPTGGKGHSSTFEQDLEREVRRRLHDDPDLQLHRFDVSVTDGKVTLTGQLRSAELRQRAEALAAGIRGVREVVNHIVVVEEHA